MIKLRTLAAAGLILPFVAFGGSPDSSLASAAADTPAALAADSVSAAGKGAESYRCCWVYYGGQWWCIPC